LPRDPPYRLGRGNAIAARGRSPRVPPLLITAYVWYRNINRLSIAYGFDALGLGPTNPTRMSLASEPLGLRWTHFACALSLLIPAFALPLAPRVLTIPLHGRGTLPYRSIHSQADQSRSVGGGLKPRSIVGARRLDQ
jgi:hypothetical protein